MTQEDLWLKSYYHAKKYYEEHNNLLIPTRYIVEDDLYGQIRLGLWLSNQRVFYRKNKLPKNRIELLEKLDIKWQVKGNDEVIKNSWMNMFLLAKEYYDKYNSLDRIYDYELNNKECIRIRNWINSQRNLKKENKLNKEQIKLLNSIEMRWQIDRKIFHPAWDRKYKLAKNYYLEHGNLLIPSDYEVKDDMGNIVKLGCWINEQRRAYKKEKGRYIEDDQISLLNDISMQWIFDKYYSKEEKENLKKETWLRYYLVLREYKNAYNTLKMPLGFTCSDKKGRKYFLYDWLSVQKNTQTDKTKINKLNLIDKNWKMYVDDDIKVNCDDKKKCLKYNK